MTYELMRIKFNKNFVSRWAKKAKGHTEWLYVKGGIDSKLDLPYNGYETKRF